MTKNKEEAFGFGKKKDNGGVPRIKVANAKAAMKIIAKKGLAEKNGEKYALNEGVEMNARSDSSGKMIVAKVYTHYGDKLVMEFTWKKSKSKSHASVETARGTFMTLKPDTAVPLKLEISDGQFKEVKSGNKTVKIRGKRPFVIGLGKNSKGKMTYWFAFFRRGVTLFRPMKEKMAKELLDMSVPAGEVRKFKAPGFKTKDAKKYGLENAAKK